MLDFQQDQAAGLRRIMAGPKPRILSLLSASHHEVQAKIISNLASTLHRQGGDVLVVHAGEDSPETMKQYDLQNLHSLMEKAIDNFNCHAIKTSSHGFAVSRLLPKNQLIRHYSEDELHSLNSLFTSMAKHHEIVLVDSVLTANNTLPLDSLNQGEIVIHLNQKPESIKQAYSLIKMICSELGRRPFSILINEANAKTAQTVFNNINQVARRFMHVELEYIGFIPVDDHLGRAARLGRSVVDAFPMASASQAFKELASKIDYRHSMQSSVQSL